MSHKTVILVFIAFALTLASCGSPAPTATPQPTAEPTAAVDATAMAQTFLDAMNSGDADTMASLLSDDAVFTFNVRIMRHLQQEPIEGKDAILAYIQGEEWGGVTVEGSKYEEENGRVIFSCKFYSGTVLLGSGSKTSNSACVIIVENGFIVFIGDQANETLLRGEG